MNKIDISKGRIGYDGVKRSKDAIINDFCNSIENDIRKRLKSIRPKGEAEKKLKKWCVDNLHDFLVAEPIKLKEYTDYVDQYFATVLNPPKDKKSRKKKRGRKPKDIKSKILGAFGYTNYRSSVLIKLAFRLNIKTCPYCNLHYTLCIEDFDKNNVKQRMARFEFDHFYDKASYPMLSMSFYNLVPSCPTCNHGKSQDKLPIDFHPYYSDIGDNFTFRLKNPVPYYYGYLASDKIELDLKAKDGKDVKSFDRTFHIKKQYERHKDIAEEVFARAYKEKYYRFGNNFSFIKDVNLRERLSKGFYVKKDEIDLRPMTKFMQDLWEQANGVI